MTEQPAIDLHGVGVHRGGKWILRDIDWTVPAGACAAILGPNGSGKSTLARILSCHLWPTRGAARVLGGLFGEANLIELRKSIRMVQAAGPYDVDPQLTARETILTGFFGTIGLYNPVTNAQQEQADRILAQVGLRAAAGQSYATLSSGERVRALIGRALIGAPRLLLLDEPTAGLDLLAREQVLATVESLFHDAGTPPTTLFITHHVEELPPATRQLLLLSNGTTAAAGAPADVLRPEVLSAVYGCDVQVRTSNGRHYLEVHPDSWKSLLAGR